ncbi:MAG: NAD-dependent epimerase/dehydratase family protein [Anaerolineae bacterium]|nr:NAD-dependent epimerase/dehydratase family protein [Anaerolineales bacterium]MCQ3974847.1 nucleoside-diphosphate sugar epimerase [Anaerolineae bacterium]
MKILVTGSSGQVGTNLCLALQQKGHTVLGIDKRANTWTDQIPFLQADLSQSMPTPIEIAAAAPQFIQPDLVAHLAANAKVHELVQDPRRAHENTTITFHVLEYCRLQNLPIIFSSSREVYGRPSPPTVGEDTTDVFHILSPYAAYKMADEMLIYAYANCYNLKYLVFRLSNVYGRYDNDIERMTRVLHIFVDQIRRGQPVTIFDRSKVIDFTYVDDCINGLMLGIEKLAAGEVVNETFNLSSGSPATLVQLAETIGAVLGVTPTILEEPIQPGEINFYVADLTKAKTILGYEPRMSFAEGIRRAVEWSLEWEKRPPTTDR